MSTNSNVTTRSTHLVYFKSLYPLSPKSSQSLFPKPPLHRHSLKRMEKLRQRNNTTGLTLMNIILQQSSPQSYMKIPQKKKDKTHKIYSNPKKDAKLMNIV